jgi:hypothetical protein
LTRAALAALRALRDCGVLRTYEAHPGLLELRLEGLASWTPVAFGLDRGLLCADFRLTDAGASRASRLTPTPEGTRPC